MTILDKIIEQKQQEVARLKQQPAPETPAAATQVPPLGPMFQHHEHMTIIAEIKRASPSKGSIDAHVDPVSQAKLYEASGAGAISVLTDETFFQGSMEDLRAVRQAVDLPILCKDFVIDKVQIDHAKAAGASVILLIVAAMPPEALQELDTYAKEQGLDVLCEVHNEAEMTTAIDSGAGIIGINNRNLKTFDVNLDTTGRLASMVEDPGTILISESGIKTRSDVLQAAGHGARGVLIGETLMRADDVTALFSDLQIPLQKGDRSNVR